LIKEHVYDKIEGDNKSYEIFRKLKFERRRNHENLLESYKVWKNSYFLSIDDKKQRNVDNINSYLELDQKSISDQQEYSFKNYEKLKLADILNIEVETKNSINKRKVEIEKKKISSIKLEKERRRTTLNYIATYKKDLNNIGYILITEVDDLIQMEEKEFFDYVSEKEKETNNFYINLENNEKEFEKVVLAQYAEFVNR